MPTKKQEKALREIVDMVDFVESFESRSEIKKIILEAYFQKMAVEKICSKIDEVNMNLCQLAENSYSCE